MIKLSAITQTSSAISTQGERFSSALSWATELNQLNYLAEIVSKPSTRKTSTASSSSKNRWQYINTTLNMSDKTTNRVTNHISAHRLTLSVLVTASGVSVPIQARTRRALFATFSTLPPPLHWCCLPASTFSRRNPLSFPPLPYSLCAPRAGELLPSWR